MIMKTKIMKVPAVNKGTGSKAGSSTSIDATTAGSSTTIDASAAFDFKLTSRLLFNGEALLVLELTES